MQAIIKCLHCGTDFTQRRRDQKYCKAQCRFDLGKAMKLEQLQNECILIISCSECGKDIQRNGGAYYQYCAECQAIVLERKKKQLRDKKRDHQFVWADRNFFNSNGNASHA